MKPGDAYGVELGEKLFGFVLQVFGVGFDVHHGVEVLRPLQRRFRAVTAQGTGGDQELSARVLRRDLKSEKKTEKLSFLQTLRGGKSSRGGLKLR